MILGDQLVKILQMGLSSVKGETPINIGSLSFTAAEAQKALVSLSKFPLPDLQKVITEKGRNVEDDAKIVEDVLGALQEAGVPDVGEMKLAVEALVWAYQNNTQGGQFSQTPMYNGPKSQQVTEIDTSNSGQS